MLKQINYKNYNVVSFSSAPLDEEYGFVDNVSFAVQAMDKQDKAINTVKNKWQYVVAGIAGVVLVIALISIIPKSKKRRRR